MMQQINLYRPIFRKQEKKFSATAMLQAGAAIVVGVVGIYAVMAWQVNAMRDEMKVAEKRLAATNKQLADLTQTLAGSAAQGKTIEDEVAEHEKQVAARLRIRELLTKGLFRNTTGYSDFLLAFARQHINGVWLTSFNITGAGEEMRLQGRTTDPAQVPRFMQRLAVEKSIAGKEFHVFMMNRPEKKEGEMFETPYVEFQFRTAAPKEQGKS